MNVWLDGDAVVPVELAGSRGPGIPSEFRPMRFQSDSAKSSGIIDIQDNAAQAPFSHARWDPIRALGADRAGVAQVGRSPATGPQPASWWRTRRHAADLAQPDGAAGWRATLVGLRPAPRLRLRRPGTASRLVADAVMRNLLRSANGVEAERRLQGAIRRRRWSLPSPSGRDRRSVSRKRVMPQFETGRKQPPPPL
ncbi:MAG: hypothetical protein QOH61_1823 [Chloroflexota bacterium]|nr:hypothetical protein [Chloroflexota bacterium]